MSTKNSHNISRIQVIIIIYFSDDACPDSRVTLLSDQLSRAKRPDVRITIEAPSLHPSRSFTIALCEVSGGPKSPKEGKKISDYNKLKLNMKGSRDQIRFKIQSKHDGRINQEILDLVNTWETILIQTYGRWCERIKYRSLAIIIRSTLVIRRLYQGLYLRRKVFPFWTCTSSYQWPFTTEKAQPHKWFFEILWQIVFRPASDEANIPKV